MQLVSEVVELIGFHGTDAKNLDLINQNSFKKSNSRNDWFGTGCYFFIEGISAKDPIELASLWAADVAWDKELRAYKYAKWIVLECKIDVNGAEILDLRSPLGLKVFNTFREMTIEKIFQGRKRLKKDAYKDSDVFDIMKQKLSLKVIIGNVYIKFAEVRRNTFAFSSNIPNVTIFCLDNSNNEYIDAKTIKLVKEGEIQL
jgi:hypothetical protein